MADKAQVMDRPGVKAEIERRGGTLTGIAQEAGLYDAACRQGLVGGSYAGAKAIAAFLPDIPFETLFPNMYLSQRAREQRIRESRGAASQNRRRRADVARAS